MTIDDAPAKVAPPTNDRVDVQTEVRIYKSKSEGGARALLAADTALSSEYEVVSTTWEPGRRRTRDWIAAMFLVWFVIGIIMIVLWLIGGQPEGSLRVVVRRRLPEDSLAAVP